MEETPEQKAAREAEEKKKDGGDLQKRMDFFTAKTKSQEEEIEKLKADNLEKDRLIAEKNNHNPNPDGDPNTPGLFQDPTKWSEFYGSGPEAYGRKIAGDEADKRVKQLELKIEADKINQVIEQDVKSDPIISKFYTSDSEYRKELDRIAKEDGMDNLPPSKRYAYCANRLARDLVRRASSDAEARGRIGSVFLENGSITPTKTAEEIKNLESDKHMSDGAKSSEGYTVEDFKRDNQKK